MNEQQIRQIIGDIEAGHWPRGTVTDGEKVRYLKHFREMLAKLLA